MMIDKNLLSYEAQQMDELCLTRGTNSFIQRQSRELLMRFLFGLTILCCIIFKRHISTALLSRRGHIQYHILYLCSFQVLFSNFRRHPPTTIHDGGRMVGRSDGSPHRWGEVSSSYNLILNNQCFCKNIVESKWTLIFFQEEHYRDLSSQLCEMYSNEGNWQWRCKRPIVGNK